MTSTFVRLTTHLPALVTIGALALLPAACGGTSDIVVVRTLAASVPTAGAASRPCAGPARVVVLVDKSGSGKEYVVEQPALEHFHTLIAVLRACGGAVAVGSIHEKATHPLETIEILVEPRPPACEARSPDSLPPMVVAELRTECNRERRAYQERRARYEDALTMRTADFDRRISHILEEPPGAARTELWNAIAQANTFLDELSEGTPATTLILVSDGVHTTGTSRVEPVAASVFMVNGLGHTGDLGNIPRRFSSLDAAFRAVGSGQR